MAFVLDCLTEFTTNWCPRVMFYLGTKSLILARLKFCLFVNAQSTIYIKNIPDTTYWGTLFGKLLSLDAVDQKHKFGILNFLITEIRYINAFF